MQICTESSLLTGPSLEAISAPTLLKLSTSARQV